MITVGNVISLRDVPVPSFCIESCSNTNGHEERREQVTRCGAATSPLIWAVECPQWSCL